MITAKEAREQTKKHIAFDVEAAICSIEKSILSAIDRGEYEIKTDAFVNSAAIMQHFETLGFIVVPATRSATAMRQQVPCLLISW